MNVTVDDHDVIVSPTGAKVLTRLAAGERVSPMDPHPATRDRLISTGLIRTDLAGTYRQLVLTDLGRRVAEALAVAG